MDIATFADLLASRALRLLPGSYAVPVDLLVELPDARVARFTARGTTIRLAVFASDALTSIVIGPQCGCGRPHDQSGPLRTRLRPGATPLLEHVIDGEVTFGWTGHEAGLLRLGEAVDHFFDLLTASSQPERSTRLATAC